MMANDEQRPNVYLGNGMYAEFIYGKIAISLKGFGYGTSSKHFSAKDEFFDDLGTSNYLCSLDSRSIVSLWHFFKNLVRAGAIDGPKGMRPKGQNPQKPKPKMLMVSDRIKAAQANRFVFVEDVKTKQVVALTKQDIRTLTREFPQEKNND